MLEIKNVSKKYWSGEALKGVTVSFGPGEIVGLFGENGAGKTTLMKSVLGYISYDGKITLDGKEITNKNIARISFATCEHSFVANLTPDEHAEFYEEQFPKFNRKRYDVLMDFFELPKKKTLRFFSTGQKNQFEVLMALCQGADYILMDEPFAGNDVFNREDFYKVLLGILEPTETVILSTHLIEEVSNFIGRAVLIHEGKIVGDVSVIDLEEKGTTLIDHVKKVYHYRNDRIERAIEALEKEE